MARGRGGRRCGSVRHVYSGTGKVSDQLQWELVWEEGQEIKLEE